MQLNNHSFPVKLPADVENTLVSNWMREAHLCFFSAAEGGLGHCLGANIHIVGLQQQVHKPAHMQKRTCCIVALCMKHN